MYLITTEQMRDTMAGLTIGGQQHCGVPNTQVFDTLQRNIRTRVESALNIEQIARGSWIDTFYISPQQANRPVALRLTNAFLEAPEATVITLLDGSATDCTMDVDSRYGIVYTTLPAGDYKVAYVAGFEAEAGSKVFKRLPDWLVSVATAVMAGWLRATAVTGVPAHVSLGDLTPALQREIQTRIYERYDRPRASVVWPCRSARSNGAAPLPVVTGGEAAW